MYICRPILACQPPGANLPARDGLAPGNTASLLARSGGNPRSLPDPRYEPGFLDFQAPAHDRTAAGNVRGGAMPCNTLWAAREVTAIPAPARGPRERRRTAATFLGRACELGIANPGRATAGSAR